MQSNQKPFKNRQKNDLLLNDMICDDILTIRI